MEMYKHLLSGDLEFASNLADEIDLEMIEYLDGTGGRPFLQRRDWWLRLKIVICWLEHVHHWQPSGLDLILREGTDKLLDNCLMFFDSITERTEDKTGDIWRSLAERLREEIEESDAVTTVRNWREKRSNAKEDDVNFPRSVQRINEDVIENLKKIHIGIKIAEGKAIKDKDISKFMSRYLFEQSDDKETKNSGKKENDNEKYLYRHLYDIPWKCTLTRSIDLFGNEKNDNSWLKDYNYHNGPKNKLLEILHHDNAIGRELYSIALEFYMFSSESPLDTMVHSYHLARNENVKISNNIKEKIKLILIPEDKDEFKSFRLRQKAARELINEYLSEIDKIIDDTSDREEKELLTPLANYLFLYSYKNTNIIDNILKSITSVHYGEEDCWKKKDYGEELKCFRMLLVSRYTVGGFYSMQEKNSQNIFTDPKLTAAGFIQNNLYFHKKLRNKNKDDCKKRGCFYPEGKIKYIGLSGRYDAMSFVKARPLFRCPIPYFGDHLYQFPSILTRREFGIRVDLNLGEQQQRCHTYKEGEKEHQLAGYISVVLKRRSLRLPFVARVLTSLNEDEFKNVLKKEAIFYKYLQKEKDTVLLLDGSADLLFVIRCNTYNNNEIDRIDHLDRIANVIDLAYWLHQDFMVEKTEIILSAAAIDTVAEEVAKGKNENRFSIDCEIRCFEDRFLSKNIEKLKEDIEKKLHESCGDNKLLVNLEITAGRKDIFLKFFPDKEVIKDLFPVIGTLCFNSNNFRKNLQMVLEGAGGYYIDRIEVNVNKQPPKYEDLFEGNKGEN